MLLLAVIFKVSTELSILRVTLKNAFYVLVFVVLLKVVLEIVRLFLLICIASACP